VEVLSPAGKDPTDIRGRSRADFPKSR
jgi:hypothetical protein